MPGLRGLKFKLWPISFMTLGQSANTQNSETELDKERKDLNKHYKKLGRNISMLRNFRTRRDITLFC